MQASHRADLPPFIRDRFTWTAYILLGYFAYLQGLQGPIMPFLRQELQLSYVIGTMHLSISAIGMVTELSSAWERTKACGVEPWV